MLKLGPLPSTTREPTELADDRSHVTYALTEVTSNMNTAPVFDQMLNKFHKFALRDDTRFEKDRAKENEKFKTSESKLDYKLSYDSNFQKGTLGKVTDDSNYLNKTPPVKVTEGFNSLNKTCMKRTKDLNSLTKTDATLTEYSDFNVCPAQRIEVSVGTNTVQKSSHSTATVSGCNMFHSNHTRTEITDSATNGPTLVSVIKGLQVLTLDETRLQKINVHKSSELRARKYKDDSQLPDSLNQPEHDCPMNKANVEIIKGSNFLSKSRVKMQDARNGLKVTDVRSHMKKSPIKVPHSPARMNGETVKLAEFNNKSHTVVAETAIPLKKTPTKRATSVHSRNRRYIRVAKSAENTANSSNLNSNRTDQTKRPAPLSERIMDLVLEQRLEDGDWPEGTDLNATVEREREMSDIALLNRREYKHGQEPVFHNTKPIKVTDHMENSVTKSLATGATKKLPYKSPSRATDSCSTTLTATEKLNTINKLSAKMVANAKYLRPKLSNTSDNMSLTSEQESSNTIAEIHDLESINSLNLPVIDFRKSNLYFRKEDIQKKTVLKSNITKGSFPSVDQYLDIQFNLLREDFVGPIREDIALLSMTKPQDTTQIKIYKEAKFIRYEVKKNKCGMLVKFDQKTKTHNSSVFMQGSLLGFTEDNFKNYFFATVIDHSKRGEVLVKVCEERTVCDLSSSVFTMIEPVVFFEPYFHVMKALQCLDESNFPMKRYIINGNCENRPPAYLLEKKEATYTIGGYQKVPVLDLASEQWPDAETLNMDRSQYKAFRAALTQEFVVVQGPPGTGKTYLGLKVAEVLLNNERAWHHGKSPIMVVCYTNHALDQFLEGLLGVTKKLVRVGGQSRSQILQPFNLKNQGKTIGWGFASEKKEISKALHSCVNQMKFIGNDLETIEKCKGIVSLHYLMRLGIVSERQVQYFGGITYFDDFSKQTFLTWLLYDDECQIENFQKYKQACKTTESKMSPQCGESDFKTDYYDLDYYLLESDIQLVINSIQAQINSLNKSKQDPLLVHSKIWVLEEQHFEVTDYLNRLRFFLSAKTQASRTLLEKFSSDGNIKNFNCYERWALYKHWEARLKWKLTELQNVMSKDVQRMEENYLQELARCNVASLQRTLIFGMTTTGAARNRQVLELLRPRIVIVEEAAEVMESHIVASLTPHCEHLILIGDHQQLRPNVNVHELRLNFGFDISLFERMLNNGMHCETLQVQHRMRPEIASLIVPTIYPVLENHTSVYKLPPVMGIPANIYFVSHSVPEEKIRENRSHKNQHEVSFLMKLCRHLILQGYTTKEITIITTYKAQMQLLMHERDQQSILHGVRIATVDDFQGEENKIILLSLVRSNSNGNIGFLRTENRICVALSRAQEGFYMIGNMKNLSGQSRVWREIRNTLIKQKAVGPSLLVRCQRHPSHSTSVSTASDFLKVPEGGCSSPCDEQLQCGHKCLCKCHIIDMEHKERYRCRQACERIVCVENHKCRKECWAVCDKMCMELVFRNLPCGHVIRLHCYIDWSVYECQHTVLRELLCTHKIELSCFVDWRNHKCEIEMEKRKCCGHTVTVTCCTDVREVTCPALCAKQLLCGHTCMRRCHLLEECGECKVPSVKEFPKCGHTAIVPCSEDISNIKCLERCPKILPCGHQCSATCDDSCSDCRVMVKQVLPSCGHEISIRCGVVPSFSDCRQKCDRKLACGHTCKALCNEPCVTRCTQECAYKELGACGHQINIPCFRHDSLDAFSEELLSYCNATCGKVLLCGHLCRSKCSKCLQGRIHGQCTDRCGKTLICGHSCDAPCYLACPPCPLKYKFTCDHGQRERIKRCFKKLDLCTEPCTWRCEHYRCTRVCGDQCNRKPCNVPCKKPLPCGHLCIGLCGEPCPPLCGVCQKDEVAAVLGYELEGDDVIDTKLRFVYLVDCRHTMEFTEMDEIIAERETHILMKTCPRCDTAIINTPRYKNYTKEYFQYEMKVKTLVFRKKRHIDSQRREAVATLKSLMDREHIRDKFKVAVETIISKSRREFFDAETLQIEACIVSEMEKKLQVISSCAHLSVKCRAVAYVEILVQALADRGDNISTEEIDSWLMELLRLQRIAELCKMLSLPAQSDETRSRLLETATDIFSSRKYVKAMDCEIDKALCTIAQQQEWKLPAEFITNSCDQRFSKILGMCEGHWLKSDFSMHTKIVPNTPKKRQMRMHRKK